MLLSTLPNVGFQHLRVSVRVCSMRVRVCKGKAMPMCLCLS